MELCVLIHSRLKNFNVYKALIIGDCDFDSLATTVTALYLHLVDVVYVEG